MWGSAAVEKARRDGRDWSGSRGSSSAQEAPRRAQQGLVYSQGRGALLLHVLIPSANTPASAARELSGR